MTSDKESEVEDYWREQRERRDGITAKDAWKG